MTSRSPADIPDTAAADRPYDVLDSSEAGSRIIRGGTLRAGGYLAGIVLTAVPSALLLRHLGVQDTGRYVTVLAVVSIAGGVFEAGMTAVGVREASVLEGEARQRLLSGLVGLRLTLTAIAMLLAVGFSVLAGYDDTMVLGTAVAGVGFLLLVVQQSYSIPLSAGLRLGTVAGLDFLRQLLTGIGIVVLVLAGSGVLVFLALQIPVGLVLAVLAMLAVRHDMRLRPRLDPPGWWRLARDVLPFALASALSVLYFRLAVVLMSLLEPGTETGLYGAAFRVIEVLNPLPALLISAALPVLSRAARDDHERLAYALGRLFEVGLIMAAWSGLALVLGGEFAIRLIAGPEFAEAVPVLQIQGGALAAFFLASVWTYALLSLRLHRALLIGNGLAVLVVPSLSLLLVPAAGAEGGAVALTAAELTLAVVLGGLLMRGRPELRPRLAVVPRVVGATAVALAIPLVLGLPSFFAAVLGTALFFGMLAALGAIPPEIAIALRAKLRR